MGREAAVNAYRDSVYDAAELNALRRIRSRSTPIVGGMLTAFQQMGNALWRPFKVAGAFVFGYSDSGRKFPPMPEIPEAFKGTDLGKDLEDSWKLREKEANAKVKAFARLANFDLTGYWQEASVASHARAKDEGVMFPEEAQAQARGDSGAAAGFVGALLASRSSGSSGRSQ
jgi:hypothetical protein